MALTTVVEELPNIWTLCPVTTSCIRLRSLGVFWIVGSSMQRREEVAGVGWGGGLRGGGGPCVNQRGFGRKKEGQVEGDPCK